MSLCKVYLLYLFIISAIDDDVIDKMSLHETANMADGASNIMEIDPTDGGDALDSRSFHGSTPFLASERQGLTSSAQNINADTHRASIEGHSRDGDVEV